MVPGSSEVPKLQGVIGLSFDVAGVLLPGWVLFSARVKLLHRNQPQRT